MKKTKLRKYVPLIKILNNLKKDHKSELIKYLDSDSIDCISCVVRNALTNKSLTNRQRAMLKKNYCLIKKVFVQLLM